MPDAIARALADLEKQLSTLDPGVRKELLGEMSQHLEDLRIAHEGDAEGAVAEFGDVRKVGAALRRVRAPRRGWPLAWLAFGGAILPALGFVAHDAGLPWEFAWFVTPLLALFIVLAYRIRRFAWLEISVGALAGAGATLLFFASATLDMGEKDGYGIYSLSEASRARTQAREAIALADQWLGSLEQMRRAYTLADQEALGSLKNENGYLVPRGAPRRVEYMEGTVVSSVELPTARVRTLGEARSLWRGAGQRWRDLKRYEKKQASLVLEQVDREGPLTRRFVPQLGGYLPWVAALTIVVPGVGIGLHGLMMGLRAILEAVFKRVRVTVA